MSSIFLSHNSKDKPFVRKLANDLRRLSLLTSDDGVHLAANGGRIVLTTCQRQ